MSSEPPEPDLRLAADAMCGGLARWLRLLGVDTSYTAGIDDAELVRQALRERRIVLSSDGRLFERRVFTSGELRGIRLPVGLRLLEQVRFVRARLHISARFPRCVACNGELQTVSRRDIADRVPARSLVWAETFYRCDACGKVYWEGTHWERIRAAVARTQPGRDDAPSG